MERMPVAEMNWFAVRTRSRHEKSVARQLEERGITAFLPLVTQLRRWSDRRKLVQFPLFPGYTFVRLSYEPPVRLAVLQTEGVVHFVGTHGHGIPIPDEQIESIQTLLRNDVLIESHPYLKIGQRVRLRGGSLEGMEGILVARKGHRMLVISVELIQRSLAIQVDGYDVEPA